MTPPVVSVFSCSRLTLHGYAHAFVLVWARVCMCVCARQELACACGGNGGNAVARLVVAGVGTAFMVVASVHLRGQTARPAVVGGTRHVGSLLWVMFLAVQVGSAEAVYGCSSSSDCEYDDCGVRDYEGRWKKGYCSIWGNCENNGDRSVGVARACPDPPKCPPGTYSGDGRDGGKYVCEDCLVGQFSGSGAKKCGFQVRGWHIWANTVNIKVRNRGRERGERQIGRGGGAATRVTGGRPWLHCCRSSCRPA